MPQRSRRTPFLAALALLPATISLAGCGDSPACVFSGNGCQGGGGPGGLGQAASLPDNGQTILPGDPKVDETFPDDKQVSSTSPVMVVFSESMAPDTAQGKIGLVPLDLGGFPLTPLPTSQVLLARGRVLVMLPAAALPPGDYVVQVASDEKIFDLTGQQLGVPSDKILANFQVDTEDPEEPAVIGTFPLPGTLAPTTTPIIVAFDRRMDTATVTDASFIVEADGAPPPFDPLPIPLTIQTGFVPIVDTRIFIYQSLDTTTGEVASLGAGADVVLTLSPIGDTILDEDEGILPPKSVDFETQGFEAPLHAEILSNPADGIGIHNLTPGDPEELTVQVDLDAGQEGDLVVITLFGLSKETEEGEDPVLFALERTKEATGAEPIVAVSFSLADLDITTDPGVATFADGTVAFACALRRGVETSPVRLLDASLSAGLQDPVLDTQAPVIEELLNPGAGVTDLYRSDVRDLVLAGNADERILRAEVTTALLGTVEGMVVGSDDDGFFVAAPLPLGLIDGGGPISYDLRVFDTVSNASEPVSGVFTQHGGIGGSAAFVAGDPIAVEVVDAVTLAPLAGARVFTHADQGDGVNFPLLDSAVTAADGTATVASAGAPAAGTLLSVDAGLYDLWTFHGVAANRVSVTLRPSVPGAAAVGGVMTTTSEIADLSLSLIDRKFDDARRPEEAEPSFDGQACSADPFGGLPLSCPFGPEPVAVGRLGALSLLAGNLGLDAGSFSASALIQAFVLTVPRPPLQPAAADTLEVVVPFLLTEPGVEPSELPIEAHPVAFYGSFATGLDLGSLTDDPVTTGDPRVTLEALVPGVPGSTMVGAGLAFQQSPGVWAVRSAYPGAVDDAGSLGLQGTVDTDLFLRLELRDEAGNRSGQRPRLSTLATLPLPFSTFAPPVAVISAPAAASTVLTGAIDVEFENALPDIAGEPGLYVVHLVDSVGRGWDLYRVDPPDGAPAEVHAPDLVASGGIGLATGNVAASVELFAWPGFDAGAFLLSDVAREHDVFSSGAPITFAYSPP